MPKRLDYLGNLIEFSVTYLSCESVSTPSFYLVWSIALLHGPLQLHLTLRACKFLIPDIEVDLWHRRSVSSLCMLFKIFHNPRHPLNSELPNSFQPVQITRNALNANSQAFSIGRCNTSQYSRCFIPATTRLWNELPSMIVEATELQKCKLGANAF